MNAPRKRTRCALTSNDSAYGLDASGFAAARSNMFMSKRYGVPESSPARPRITRTPTRVRRRPRNAVIKLRGRRGSAVSAYPSAGSGPSQLMP